MILKKLYWRAFIICLALRWVKGYNIGDMVWFEGEQWMLIQGVCAPSWDLVRGERRVDHVHELRFRKVRSLRNYWQSYTSGYYFYMTSWYDIWVHGGIKPWMRGCNIWAK